jgi:hypothetical protein
MSDPSRDRELEALFQGLREEERARSPDLATMMAEVRRSLASDVAEPDAGPRWWRWHPTVGPRLAWAGGALAAAAAAVLLVVGTGQQEDPFVAAVRAFQADPTSGAWRSPTDDLLHVPGLELVTSLPSIGGPPVPDRPAGPGSRNQL